MAVLTNKDKYRALCEQECSIPIFSQAWWLDAVAGDNWDVTLVEKGGHVYASLPYTVTNKYGFTKLKQPQLTQNLGPWIRPSTAKYAKKLGKEKDLMEALIQGLPTYDSYHQNWHHTRQNWLPFYWKGFEQTSKYTYRIENILDLDSVWSGFQDKIRTDIRKASNRARVNVRTDCELSEFIELNRKVFSRQGIGLPYRIELIERIEKAAAKQGQRKIFIAQDNQGRSHAGVYIVWDENSAYYIMGGSDPELRNSGATSLCMWEAIKFASTVTKSFDFEGSMLEPVERFFRSFGATQTPYHTISHTPSKTLRWIDIIRKFKR